MTIEDQRRFSEGIAYERSWWLEVGGRICFFFKQNQNNSPDMTTVAIRIMSN